MAAVAATLLATSSASAQTLTESFAYTYNNNPQILAQRSLLRATDEQVPQALSNWRPTITLTGQAGFERAGVSARGASTTFSSFGNETMNLWRDGEGLLALVNVAAQLLLGLGAVWLGRVLGDKIWG